MYDGKGLEQREMLKHHANAQLSRRRWILNVDWSAIPEHFTFVGFGDTIDDLHQRALAGAVFAEHRMYLAGHDFEIYVGVGDNRGIGFGNLLQLQARRATGRIRMLFRNHIVIVKLLARAHRDGAIVRAVHARA